MDVQTTRTLIIKASFIQFKIQIFTFSSGFLKNNDTNRMIFSDIDKIS